MNFHAKGGSGQSQGKPHKQGRGMGVPLIIPVPQKPKPTLAEADSLLPAARSSPSMIGRDAPIGDKEVQNVMKLPDTDGGFNSTEERELLFQVFYNM